jgi:CheY-like chemotaxis protein
MSRILVADDDQAVRMLLCAVLTDAGYEVASVEDGAQAMEQVRSDRPDLLVLDLMMPRMTGHEVLDALGHEENRPPVLLVSASEAAHDEVRSHRADGAVSKPFDLDQLVEAVELLLGRAG